MQDTDRSSPSAFESLFIEVIALAGRLKRPMLPQGAGLDVGPRRVLQVLAHEGPLTVPQIGRLLGTSRQNIQVIVNRLKNEGLVELLLNPVHERSVLTQATESGKSLVTPSIEEQTRIFGELNARFPNSRVDSASRLLREIRGRLDGNLSSSHHGTTDHEPPLNPAAKQAPSPKPTAAVEPLEDYELPVNLL